MRDILKHLKTLGKTILISSHILPELAEMCDEIGVLDKGRLIAQGNVAAIQAQLTGDKEMTIKVISDVASAVRHFEEDPNISTIEANIEDGIITFLYKGTREEQVTMLKKALINDIAIYSATEMEKNLEDIFMAITKEAQNNATKTV